MSYDAWKLAAPPDDPYGELDALEGELVALRDERDELDERVDELVGIIRDLWPRAAMTMHAENEACWRERLEELGVEL